MFVEVGVTKAFQATMVDGRFQRQQVDGEFVTEFKFAPGLSVEEAARDVVNGLTAHMADEKPAWVESDNKTLKDILCDHFAVDKRKKKTPVWGNN